MQERQIRSLGQEDPLEKKMATHCSILAWEIPWTEEPGGLQSMGVKRRAGHDLAAKQQQRGENGRQYITHSLAPCQNSLCCTYFLLIVSHMYYIVTVVYMKNFVFFYLMLHQMLHNYDLKIKCIQIEVNWFLFSSLCHYNSYYRGHLMPVPAIMVFMFLVIF